MEANINRYNMESWLFLASHISEVLKTDQSKKKHF